MQDIIGWDIGGAHLKAARVENGDHVEGGAGRLPAVARLGRT